MKRVLPENEGKYNALSQRELFAILNFNSEEILEMERAERNKFYLIDNLVYGTKYSEDLEKDKIEVGLFKDFIYVPRLECQQSKDLRKKFVPNVVDEGHVVENIEGIVNPHDKVFFDGAHIKAIHDVQKKGRIDALRKAVGLDADIDKPNAPEDAFEANPKDNPDWMV